MCGPGGVGKLESLMAEVAMAVAPDGPSREASPEKRSSTPESVARNTRRSAIGATPERKANKLARLQAERALMQGRASSPTLMRSRVSRDSTDTPPSERATSLEERELSLHEQLDRANDALAVADEKARLLQLEVISKETTIWELKSKALDNKRGSPSNSKSMHKAKEGSDPSNPANWVPKTSSSQEQEQIEAESIAKETLTSAQSKLGDSLRAEELTGLREQLLEKDVMIQRLEVCPLKLTLLFET